VSSHHIDRLECVANARLDKIGYTNFILKRVRKFTLWNMSSPVEVIAIDTIPLANSRGARGLQSVRVSEAVVRAEKTVQLLESVHAMQA